jgi:hypothetical protein
MNRKQFILRSSLAAGAVFTPILNYGKSANDIDDKVVKEFVGASHGREAKVKELLEEYPGLIYSTWDWGTGD